MNSTENLDFPISVTKRFIKEHLDQDMQLPAQFTKTFAKALRVFIHYIASISDDIAQETRKGILNPKEVEAAIKEVGLENLLKITGEAPKPAPTELASKKKPKRKRDEMEKTTESAAPTQPIEEENVVGTVQDTVEEHVEEQKGDNEENEESEKDIEPKENEVVADEESEVFEITCEK